MSKKGDGRPVGSSLFSLKQYLTFFLLISFVVTACFLLFLNLIDIEFVDLSRSALLTFGNVLFLSLLCTVIDGFRRKLMVERPVKRILHATQQLTQGDFSTRIEPLHREGRMNEFDLIIADFNKMARELSGIETLRADFIASVSHELKTPLSVISNYVAMLQDAGLDEETRSTYIQSIGMASLNLSQLITNILRLNKLENQQIFPRPQPFQLGEQLRQCLLGFEEAWTRKDIVIETDIDDMEITADAELLTLVWNNLISNAVKFTGTGGRIAVSLKEESGAAVVRVADSGCGISPETGGRIFDKFYQGDSSHAIEGNGLGLSLVKRVVDIIGGEIIVESELDKGSIFTVRINSNDA